MRRLLAACLDGASDGRDGVAVSFSAGISAIPGLARDRDSLYGQADAALFWGKRHGRTCVTVYDADRHEAPITQRAPAELSAMVARVAATGAVRAVFQPIYDLATGVPRGFEGLVRPLPDSGFADAGSMFEAAEATGRTGELDLACLNTVMETAARLRLPGSLTINLSPRTMEMDDFSVHALLRMIVRHGLDPRHIVLELTEREAVEDIGRLRRSVEACRVAGIRLAADDVGAGNAGLRLLSQLRFDIVKIDLSLVQGGAVHDASLEIVRTLRDLADRWGALVVAEGIETPAQLDVVRSLGIGAGQGYLLGRPTDRPSTEPLDLDALGPEHGLAHRAPAHDAGMSAHTAHPRSGAVRLTPGRSLLDCRHVAAIAVDEHVETALTWFGSGDRRKVAVVVTSDGRRVHVPIDPADVSLLDLLLSLPGLGGLLELITGSRRDRGTRRDERR